MSKLRKSLAWQFILSLLILSIISTIVSYIFMQTQMRDNYLATQMEIVSGQARLYSERLKNNEADAQTVTKSMSSITGGDTYFLLGSDGKYIAHSDTNKIGTSSAGDFSPNTLHSLLVTSGFQIIDKENGLLIASYKLPSTSSTVVSISTFDKRLAGFNNIRNYLLGQIITWLLLLTITTAGLTAWVVAEPARRLSEYINQLGEKNFVASLEPSKFRGELSLIAERLMGLSATMQDTINDLEQRVFIRTRELEERAIQMKVAADVGKSITSVRNLTEVLYQTTLLISERFGYYHVGIFLLDERREYAILTATNSEGGRRMLDKKHQLKVGETGIVGYVTKQAKARIALDVGRDAVYFDNPDLPNTRSEMALPIIASGQILGALDVQSTEAQAFSEEDIATLQILTDQLAVAIQNANLFHENEKALEAARQVYGDASREAWGRILRNEPRVGYIATPPATTPTYSAKMDPLLATAFDTGDVVLGSDNLTISLPIRVRGRSIGAIRLKKSEIAEAWTQDEINLAIALADQLSGALESARLYRESQQRASRESLVSDISSRIGAVSQVDAILRETVQELGQTIGNSTVTFQLLDQSNGQEQTQNLESNGTSPRGNGKARV